MSMMEQKEKAEKEGDTRKGPISQKKAMMKQKKEQAKKEETKKVKQLIETFSKPAVKFSADELKETAEPSTQLPDQSSKEEDAMRDAIRDTYKSYRDTMRNIYSSRDTFRPEDRNKFAPHIQK